jgi:apolipoprotein N-acyltransferase
MERYANRILLMTGRPRAVLAMAAGGVTVFAQAPFHVFAVCFLTFPVLIWLLDGAIARPSRSWLATAWPAFATGWLFGFGYFVAGLWWIGNALFVEAEEFIWMWPFAVLALPAVLAVFYGLACVVARMLWSDGFGRIAALALGFGLAEWLRSFALTGFPWNAIGYAAMPSPVLMQSASLIGIFGMNAVAVFVFALPAAFVQGRWRASVAAVLVVGLLAADAGYGYWRLDRAAPPPGEPKTVRIVQPAVNQSEKWDAAKRTSIFADLIAFSEQESEGGGRPDIIVWPETAVPFILTDEPDAVAAVADALEDRQILLAGGVRVSETEIRRGRPAYFNSILALNGDGVIFDAADKKHLVPFGEFLPFAEMMDRIGLKAVAAADRGYSAAERRRTLSLPDGVTVLPSICYEAIFPGAVDAEGDAPTLIVNVTNDAWYGNTPGPYQHAHQARIRAVENGLPMVRAANNGISAVYDAYGRQIDALGYGVRGAVDVALPAPLGETFYQHEGRMAFWILMAGLALIAAAARSRGGWTWRLSAKA